MAQKKITKSIMGSEVDFDLMKVKQTMLNRDKPQGVEVREQYIDIRRRRNPRRNVADLEREQNQNVADAREKIQRSKENRIKAEEAANTVVDVVEDAPVDVVVNDESSAVIKAKDVAAPATSKKKIVKKTD